MRYNVAQQLTSLCEALGPELSRWAPAIADRTSLFLPLPLQLLCLIGTDWLRVACRQRGLVWLKSTSSCDAAHPWSIVNLTC